MTKPQALPRRAPGRAGVQFRLFGFPVVIDLSFVIVLGFLGYTTVSRGLAFLLIWIFVAIVAVLLHELGHAFAARAAGAAPDIELSGFGGVTTFSLAQRPSRLRSLGISAAGPVSGLVIGAGLILLTRTINIAPASTTAFVLEVAVFVTVGWGVLNLLPILPMDGGHILTELLPGTPERRDRLAAGLSVGLAVVLAAIALYAGWLFAGLLFGYFAFINFAGLRPQRAAAGPEQIDPEQLTPEQLDRRTQDSRAALWLIDQGRVQESRHLAETAPAGIDPAVAGVLLAHLGEIEAGSALVRQAVEAEPDDPLYLECLQRIRRLRPVDGST